jgi:eukaryotic-like serine/threonine-protein kinase
VTTSSEKTADGVSAHVLARVEARVGTTLRQKWHLDTLLGVGATAAVYSATHRNGSRAAIKILHAEWPGPPSTRDRFLREGQVANRVGHDGAVRVVDDDVTEDGALVLVTELLDGETLEDRRVRLGGRLPVDEVLFFADQVLDVLAAAHAEGITHRDLKPGNLFLTRRGVVKVFDFGIARFRELASANQPMNIGGLSGTPRFMPPEQVRGLTDEIDARSDLWACGATIFELLSGRSVHEGETPYQVMMSAATTSAPRFASVAPESRPSLAALIDRALEFDKTKRWADAAAMREAVRDAYHDAFGRPLSTAQRPTVPDVVADRTSRSMPLPVARLTTDRPVVGEPPPERDPIVTPTHGKARALVGAAAAAAVLIVAAAPWAARKVLHVRAPSVGSTNAASEVRAADRILSLQLRSMAVEPSVASTSAPIEARVPPNPSDRIETPSSSAPAPGPASPADGSDSGLTPTISATRRSADFGTATIPSASASAAVQHLVRH